MMSENAFRDLNLLPKCERANDSSSKDILAKPYVDPTNENIEGKQRKCIVSLVEAPMNGNEVVNCGTEVVVAEVEYIESEKLDDLEDVDKGLKMLLAGLESKDWVLLCETLNNVRRFSIYHKEALQDILDNVISFVVKSLKNPRSAVCKTAIMTSADVFKAFGDHVIEMLDPMVLDYECNKMTILDCECNKESQWNKPADSTSSVTKNLVQLLLKSSQDKRFVCEAAEKALIALTIWVSPILLLPKLQPYLKNRNPRIRAKASMCFSRSVPRLGAEGIKEYGIDKLIQIASSQLSDQLPESREAARTLLSELQTAYEKSPVLAPEPDTPSEQLKAHSWQQFCESSLSKLSAQAVLRATSITREGLVSGL